VMFLADCTSTLYAGWAEHTDGIGLHIPQTFL
jgi:hypothetical protein